MKTQIAASMLIVFSLVSCKSTRSGFDSACNLASNFNWSSFKTRLEGDEAFIKLLEKEVGDKDVLTEFNSLKTADESQRYQLLKFAVEGDGKGEFNCEPLKKY